MNVQASVETDSLYKRDFHAWLQVQARLLRRGDLDALDVVNLLEEVEDMGAAQISELESRIAVIIEHLLKFQYGIERRPAAGWKRTLLVQRFALAKLLRKNPSLKPKVAEAVSDNYLQARRIALASFEEHELHRLDRYTRTLPAGCPYAVERILDPDWLPDPAG